MPYLESTTNEFLELACESAFSDRKRKTVDELLAKARKTLKRKLKTVADCDDYMAAIRSESTKFNECLKTLQVAKKKYDAGKIVPKDFDETVKAATMLLNKNCKQLQAKLGNFVDDKRAITSEEIAAFNAYVKGLGVIVKEISKERKASAAKESVDGLDFEMDFDPDIDFAMEGADENDCDDEDDDDDKKSKKKSKSKKDDDDEDDEDEDDKDDEKKSKSKSKSKDDDDSDDEDDEDDEKPKKSKKDDKDDFDFDDSDFDFGDDDKDKKDSDDDDDEDDDDDKKSKKKSKSKKDDDDEDDEDEDDKDDEKKSKSAKESVFGDIFDFDD